MKFLRPKFIIVTSLFVLLSSAVVLTLIYKAGGKNQVLGYYFAEATPNPDSPNKNKPVFPFKLKPKPTKTPKASPTPTNTADSTPSPTDGTSTPSATPTPSASATPVVTNTSTPTSTPKPTATATPAPTATATPAPTSTPTPTPVNLTQSFSANLSPVTPFTPSGSGQINGVVTKNSNGYWDFNISGSFQNLMPNRIYQFWFCGSNCSSNTTAKFQTDGNGNGSFSNSNINHSQGNDPLNRVVVWEEPPTGEVPNDPTACFKLSNSSTPCLRSSFSF